MRRDGCILDLLLRCYLESCISYQRGGFFLLFPVYATVDAAAAVVATNWKAHDLVYPNWDFFYVSPTLSAIAEQARKLKHVPIFPKDFCRSISCFWWRFFFQ
jgi:hypothetical protein